MSRKLYVRTVSQVEYDCLEICSCGGQEALYDIFEMFEIETMAKDCYDDEYEVEREELRVLRTIITENDEIFQEHVEEFDNALTKAGLDRDRFVQVLDKLIDNSEQRNSAVSISWF